MNLFESLYYLGLSAKKYFVLKNQKKLPYKVISIGNITVGGTGKTPATIAVAEEAKKRGFMPVILTRGYRGSIKGPAFVTEGNGPLLSADEAGDEPVLMAEKLKGIPVVKCADRYTGGMFAIQKLNSQKSESSSDPLPLTPNSLLFILDDGFQHWKLHRDKDIVLIDIGNPFGNRKLLPFGRLREPLKSLERADIIVLSKQLTKEFISKAPSPSPLPTGQAGSPSRGEGYNISPPLRGGDEGEGDVCGFTNDRISKFPDSNDQTNYDLVNEIRKYNPGAPIFHAEHKPVFCRLLSGERKPLSWISGKKLFGFCAIANPKSFMETIRSAGAELAGFESYRDHYKYNSSDIMEIKGRADESGAGWIVTTEKDMIKLKYLDLPENILIIEIEFLAENGFLKTVFDL